MAGSKLQERTAAAKQLEQEIHLVQAPTTLAPAKAANEKAAKKLRVAVKLASKRTTMDE